MKTKNLIKTIAAVLSVTGVIVAIGFGCGLAFQPVGEYDQSSLDNNTGGNIGGGGPGSPIVVVPGKLTVQVPRYMNMYNTLLSQLQVTTPSAATRTELTRQQGSFSESGQVTTINASFTFAATSLSAAICLDRINLENQAGAQRQFFNQVNLAGNSNLLTDAILIDVINRLARANWNRNQSAAEQATLLTAVRQSMDLDTANNATETREAMLYLCTAVASSISGYQL